VIKTKYDCVWVGIDAGREGLWKEPIWTEVLRVISMHRGERVYDPSSPVYIELERAFPKEAWRSTTAEGQFRPLFRDYPNSWTRTGVISLSNQMFHVTEMGESVLARNMSKSAVLLGMFKRHSEFCELHAKSEKPFSVLAAGLLTAPRPLTTDEVYWAIMKNFRPGEDELRDVLKRILRRTDAAPASTPYRRLRNMLTLMRAAEAVSSTRRGTSTVWSPLNVELLEEIKT
jgi:hypothetical protein